MANPTADTPDQPGRLARFRRELRNPAMSTVFLLLLAVFAIPLALLIPSWISTTQKSLEERNAAEALRDAQILSSSVLVPSQIAPWIIDQVERMERATSPAAWNYTNFTAGPCSEHNLSQLPPGIFTDGIATSCDQLNLIQIDHASECTSIQTCELSPSALRRLDVVRTSLFTIFDAADLVIPYEREEEVSGQ